MKLNLGCGEKKIPGYVGVDKTDYPEVDIVYDLSRFPWPFESNSCEEVIMYNVLEHLESPYRAILEVIRICKEGAIFRIRFPVPTHPNAWLDPEHKYTFTPEWFNQFGELKMVEVKKHYAVPKFGRLCKIADFLGFFFGLHKYGADEYRLTFKKVFK